MPIHLNLAMTIDLVTRTATLSPNPWWNFVCANYLKCDACKPILTGRISCSTQIDGSWFYSTLEQLDSTRTHSSTITGTWFGRLFERTELRFWICHVKWVSWRDMKRNKWRMRMWLLSWHWASHSGLKANSILVIRYLTFFFCFSWLSFNNLIFSKQNTTKRIAALVPTMVAHRLCPPPEEIYSIHRKLSGVFLLCARLNVKMNCRRFFEEIVDKKTP